MVGVNIAFDFCFWATHLCAQVLTDEVHKTVYGTRGKDQVDQL